MSITKSFLLLVLTAGGMSSCKGQQPSTSDELSLQKVIPLPGVKGRIDHLDINLARKIVYIAALGNNSLEVVDLAQDKLLRSVPGFDEPQGVVYIPQTNEIMVANGGNGTCVFLNGENFQTTATLKLGSDADDVRYDPASERIFVGYGNGGIAIVDAKSHQQLADIRLPAHPEGFQLSRNRDQLMVNVPDAGSIFVLDLKGSRVGTTWKAAFSANFPIAADPEDQLFFIGFRHPARLAAVEENSGKLVASVPLIADVDDLYYDGRQKKIYASGGGGAIDIFRFNNSKLEPVGSMSTRSGARTSLLVPALNSFLLAERAGDGKPAQLLVYQLKK